jgi:hypothetical protein
LRKSDEEAQRSEPGQPSPFLQDVISDDFFNEEDQTFHPSPEVKRADWYDASTAPFIDSYSMFRGVQSGPPASMMDKFLGRTPKVKGKDRKGLTAGFDSLRRVQSVIGANTSTNAFPRGQGDQEEYIL